VTRPGRDAQPRGDANRYPLDDDNQTVFQEYIHLDKNNKDILHNEVTTIDHALMRRWLVYLMPAQRGQPAPDLRYFRQAISGAEVARKGGVEHFAIVRSQPAVLGKRVIVATITLDHQ
jgi:hypothetical protein